MTQIHRKQQNGKRYSPEARKRAIRLVIEQRDRYCSQWETINAMATKIGCTAETLRGWVCQNASDSGQRPGLSSEERQRLKALECDVRELRQATQSLFNVSYVTEQAMPYECTVRAS